MMQRFLALYIGLFTVAALLVQAGNRAAKADARTSAQMWFRYFSALVISGVALLAALHGPSVFAVVLIPLIWMGLREFLGVVGGDVKLGPWLGSLVALCGLVSGSPGYSVGLVIVVVYLLVRPIWKVDLEVAIRSGAMTLLGLMYIAFLGSHSLRFGEGEEFFPRLAFFLFLIFSNDAFAQLWGRIVGGRRIAPQLSPNKTLGGSLGAAASTLLVGYLLRFALPSWGTPAVLGLTLLLALAGQLGDLVASSFKRMAAVKDYGASMPAFGGVMDRFDSFFFAAPIFAAALALAQRA
jgi:phosphatidate cytidylyltransferase